MSLEIEFKLADAELLMQQDTLATLTLRNAGREAIIVDDPAHSPDYPAIKVRNKGTGEERVMRRPRKAMVTIRSPKTLEPGGTIENKFWLKEFVGFEHAGEYELIAEYGWNDNAAVGRSAPVSLTLRGVTPSQIGATLQPWGLNKEFYLFWLRTDESGTQLTRSTAVNYDAPSIAKVETVGPAPAGIQPVASICAPGGDSYQTWLAWLDGRTLMTWFVPRRIEEHKQFKLPLPEATIRIIANPLTLNSGRCETMLWMAAPKAAQAKLQLALVGADGKQEAGDFVMLPTAVEPNWSRTLLLANQERRVYVATGKDGQVQVLGTFWKEGVEMTAARPIASLPGRFVAATVRILDEDIVSGALFSQSTEDPRQLQKLVWFEGPDHAVESTEPQTITLEEPITVDRWLGRMDANGLPYALARPNGKPWLMLHPDGEAEALKGLLATYDGPIELMFHHATTPGLILAQPGQGFYFTEITGAPIESRRP